MAEKRKLVKRVSGHGCSECDWKFIPGGFQKMIPAHLSASTALQLEFDAHKCADHPPLKGTPEDFSQAAVRIVREATEKS